MLTLVAVVTLVQDLSLLTYGHVLPVAVYLAAALRIASYTCAAFLTQHERKHDVITSGVQFTFWIILLLCDVIPFYTYIMKEVYHTDLLKFVMLCVTFGGEAVQVVLFSFSEAPDYIKRSGYNSFEKHPCPEMTASFPNQMLFSWMTRYVYRGWRKDLEETDLFVLNPRDSSKMLVPPFEHQWEREKHTFKQSQLAKAEKDSYINLEETSIHIPAPSTSGKQNGLTETTSLVSDTAHSMFMPANSKAARADTIYGTGTEPGAVDSV
ncbi:hypothetical protein V1264_016612 [Littorina saxatilis]|uniref:Uncharacterized protein n=1 Tax=Littorina saxatilis TaxID=31220 RepID=A0AAN9BHV9_9CAEN